MREHDPRDPATSTPFGPSERQLAEQAARDEAARQAAGPKQTIFRPSTYTRPAGTKQGTP